MTAPQRVHVTHLQVLLPRQVDESRLSDLLTVGQIQLLHLGHEGQLQESTVSDLETVAQIQLGQLYQVTDVLETLR